MEFQKKNSKIRFLTYNILTSHNSNESVTSIYESEINAPCWKDRKINIVSDIVKADVIVLVEITKLQLDSILELSKSLKRNYKAVHFLKKDCTDGTAILYDYDRFIDIGWISAYLNPESNTQIVVSLMLYELATEKEFLVTGLHLKSGYKDMESKREEQITIALDKVNKWLTDNDRNNLPHILAGDLNTEFYNSPATRLYENSHYRSKVLTKLEAYGFTNAFTDYSNTDNLNKYYPYVTYNYWQSSIFDYIYYKHDLVISDQFIPKIDGKIPDSNFGSDHLPVYVTINI